MSRRQLYYRKGDTTSSVYGLTTGEWQNVKDLATNYDPDTCKGLYFYDARPIKNYVKENDTYTIPMSLDGDGDLSINVDGKIYKDFTPEAGDVSVTMKCRSSAIGGKSAKVSDGSTTYFYYYPAYVYTDVTVSGLPSGCTLDAYIYTETGKSVGYLTFTSDGSKTLTNTITDSTSSNLGYVNHYTRMVPVSNGYPGTQVTYSHGRYCWYSMSKNRVITGVSSSKSYYSNTSTTGSIFKNTIPLEDLFTKDNSVEGH